MSRAPAPVTVHMLTYAPTPEQIYGATLSFKTLRTGFPDAVVHVVDNNSCAEALAEIERLARETDCRLTHLTSTTRHYSFLSDVILGPENVGTHVIIDPDVMFWANCQDFRFDALLAGRLVPTFFEEFSGCINYARLHSSFWWIRDIAELRERVVREFHRTSIGYLDAFAPYVFKDPLTGSWYKFDTGANLYSVFREDSYAFQEPELDCFDHLIVGSHMETVIHSLSEMDQDAMRKTHAIAREDFTQLRGVWRAQEYYFKIRAVPTVPEMLFGR